MKINHYKKNYISRLKSCIAILILLTSFCSYFSFSANHTKTDNVSSKKKVEIATPLSLSNPWAFLKPYQAKYSFLLDHDKLGLSTRTFSRDQQYWVLDTCTSASKFIINLKSTENSKFHIKDGRLMNDRFVSFSKRTFKKAKKVKQFFDWDSKLETGSRNKKKWLLPIESQVYDRVSHLIQLRADLINGKKEFSYAVSHKGKVQDYLYQLDTNEVITTKMGELTVQKYVRAKSNGATFAIWMSPELAFFPVKISQSKKDSPTVTLLLESIDYLMLPEEKI